MIISEIVWANVSAMTHAVRKRLRNGFRRRVNGGRGDVFYKAA